MAEVTTDILEKQIDKVLTLTGEESFLNWTDFEGSSRKVVEAVETLNKEMNIFRQAQQIYFISNMKKMKGTDLPDMFKLVKANKLHPKALKSTTNRFKLNGEELELAEPIQELKKQAQTALASYVENNNEIVDNIQKLTNFFKQRVVKYDFKPGVLPSPKIEESQKYEFKNKFDDNDLQSVCNTISLQFIPGTDNLIGLKTYSQIIDGSVELCDKKFAKLSEDARAKQRALMDKPKEYLEAMNEYLIGSETLITDAQLSIVSKLGVPIQKFEESEMLLMERGLTHNILTMQTLGRAKLREKVKPTKSVTMDQSQQIVNYQLQLITSKADYIQSILAAVPRTQQSTQLIPMLLTFILNDLVYEKYQIEEQDFMQNLNEQAFVTNPELMILFQKMEGAILGLMQKIGILPDNIGEVTPSQLGIPPPGLPTRDEGKGKAPGMLPPMGLMPGADPLAYQQMQAQLNMLNKKK